MAAIIYVIYCKEKKGQSDMEIAARDIGYGRFDMEIAARDIGYGRLAKSLAFFKPLLCYRKCISLKSLMCSNSMIEDYL